MSTTIAHNGLPGDAADGSSGGSYFSKGNSGKYEVYGTIGGGGGQLNDYAPYPRSSGYSSGCGGTAGEGAEIIYEDSLKNIHAYNGSYITNITAFEQSNEWKVNNQSIIYMQLGFDLVNIRNETKEFAWRGKTLKMPVLEEIISRSQDALIEELGNDSSYRTAIRIKDEDNNDYGLGIGSGAGFIEISNGSCTKK